MNQKDLNNDTAHKIVENATLLFNKHGFAGTSISDIAKKSELSKGILYHYFENKDALYLHCLNWGIEKFSKYMDDATSNLSDEGDVIAQILKLRLSFFDKFPQYKNLFHDVISLKPNQLAESLSALKIKMREGNLRRFRALTKGMFFGKGITERDIMAFLTMLQNSSQYISDNGDVENSDAFESSLRLTKIFINGLKTDII